MNVLENSPPMNLFQDLLENGPMGATNFAMLGLGDIVIPGIFIALLLRYDNSLKRGSNFYFNATFAGILIAPAPCTL